MEKEGERAIEEMREEIIRLQSKFLRLRKRSLLPAAVVSEWKNFHEVFKGDLSPLIDEISQEIERSTSLEETKKFHQLYHACYQLVFLTLNYGRNRLAELLNQQQPRPQRQYEDEIGRCGGENGFLLRQNSKRHISRQRYNQILNCQWGGYDVVKDGISTTMSDDLPPPEIF